MSLHEYLCIFLRLLRQPLLLSDHERFAFLTPRAYREYISRCQTPVPSTCAVLCIQGTHSHCEAAALSVLRMRAPIHYFFDSVLDSALDSALDSEDSALDSAFDSAFDSALDSAFDSALDSEDSAVCAVDAVSAADAVLSAGSCVRTTGLLSEITSVFRTSSSLVIVDSFLHFSRLAGT